MHETLDPRGAVSAAPAPRGVRLSEVQGLGKIDLRGDPEDRNFMSAVGRALELLLPTEPCQSAHQGEVAALWTGPDQWLIICPRAEVGDVAKTLGGATSSAGGAVTDISAGRAVLRLAGPDAHEILAKGCPLDLHPSMVKPGHVAGSVLAKITVLIHLRDREIIDIHLGRSFADYLWAWLEEAGMECGLSIG